MNKDRSNSATLKTHESRGTGEILEPKHDLSERVREYVREKPEVVALWCLGIGFVLGWKLKPW